MEFLAAQRPFRILLYTSQLGTEERRRVFYVGGQREKLYPSPLPHIRDFGRQAPPPCTFQGYKRRRPL